MIYQAQLLQLCILQERCSELEDEAESLVAQAPEARGDAEAVQGGSRHAATTSTSNALTEWQSR
jgi:hypothetical protein